MVPIRGTARGHATLDRICALWLQRGEISADPLLERVVLELVEVGRSIRDNRSLMLSIAL